MSGGRSSSSGVAEREPCARVPKHVPDGRGGEPDVDRHRDEAGLHDAERRHQILRPVGGDDRHPVAAPQIPGEDGAGHRPRALLETAPRPPFVPRCGVDHESPVPIEGEIDEVAQVAAFHGG